MELINFQIFTISDIVLLVLFSVTFIIQMYFLLGVYLKLVLHRKEDFNPEISPVTIILPLRNEESGIRELVTKFTELPFHDYQLIVIDEVSEDDTLHILNILAETNPRLKVTSLSQESRFQEKQSINIGLKGASSLWIVQLTANSVPVSQEWLSKLGCLPDNNTDAVIAYTTVERKKGYRNLICRLELFTQFMISGSRVLTGKPFVFSENNVLFRKSMYFNNQGFKHKLNLNFANLELIFNENFRKGRVKITTDPEIAVRERIEDDRGDHIKLLKKTVQIRQHLSRGKKANLFLDDFTKILFIGVAITLIILHTEYWITFSSVLLIYFVSSLIIVKKTFNPFEGTKNLRTFVFLHFDKTNH